MVAGASGVGDVGGSIGSIGGGVGGGVGGASGSHGVVVVDALVQRLLRGAQWFARDRSLYVSYLFVRRYAPDTDDDTGGSGGGSAFAIRNRRNFPTRTLSN